LNDANSLKGQLKEAGLSEQAIDAAWPSWWSDEAESSPSACAELRFTVARSLGLSAKSLLGERVEFVWPDKAKFKNLDAAVDETERSALNSFGVSVARLLIHSTQPGRGLVGVPASDLREALLATGEVDIVGLLSACWSTGIPVAYLRVSPIRKKAMHAMVVGQGGRHAILLSRASKYPAPVAFYLAHEIGHIALGHVPTDNMIVDVGEPVGPNGDDEEEQANRYALELLMGDPDPAIEINFEGFNSNELADVVLRAGPEYGIEPGTLALAVAKQRGAWPVAMAAMRRIYPNPGDMALEVNKAARAGLDLKKVGRGGSEFLQNIIGMDDV